MKRNTLNTFITATLIMLLGMSSSAQAIVPMGDLMGSTFITYGDENHSVKHSIRSILVPAAPILSESDPEFGYPCGTKDCLQLHYTITSKANGKDTYNLTSEVDRVGLAGASSPALFCDKYYQCLADQAELNVILGATAAMKNAAVGADEVEVPSDGVPDDEVNGISKGDVVVINANAYRVEGDVVDDGNTATIPLAPPLIGPVAFGDRIAERKVFAVSLENIGTLAEGAESSSITINVQAVSTSDQEQVARHQFVVESQVPVEHSLAKYLRNTTSEDSNPKGDKGAMEEWVEQGYAYEYPANSKTFYFRTQLPDDEHKEKCEEDGWSGWWACKGEYLPPEPNQDIKVNAEENDILEYLIVVKAGNQVEQYGNMVIVEDLSPFLELLPDSAKLDDNDKKPAMLPRFAGTPDRAEPQISMYWCGKGNMSSVFDADDCEFIELLRQWMYDSTHITYQARVLGREGGEVAPGEGGEQKDQRMISTEFSPGTAWSQVVAAGRENHPELTACWCANDKTASYCMDKGWSVGKNAWLSAAIAYDDERMQTKVDRYMEEYASGPDSEHACLADMGAYLEGSGYNFLQGGGCYATYVTCRD